MDSNHVRCGSKGSFLELGDLDISNEWNLKVFRSIGDSVALISASSFSEAFIEFDGI